MEILSTASETKTGIDVIGNRLFWVAPYHHYNDSYAPLIVRGYVVDGQDHYELTRAGVAVRQLQYFTSPEFEGAYLLILISLSPYQLKLSEKYIIALEQHRWRGGKYLIYLPRKIIMRANISHEHYGKHVLLTMDTETSENRFIAVLTKESGQYIVVDNHGEFVPFELYKYRKADKKHEYVCGNNVIYTNDFSEYHEIKAPTKTKAARRLEYEESE